VVRFPSDERIHMMVIRDIMMVIRDIRMVIGIL
jgi:hypothetical protein